MLGKSYSACRGHCLREEAVRAAAYPLGQLSTVRAHDDHQAVTDAPLVATRYYVRGAPLQALLVAFIDRWTQERPTGRRSRGESGRWTTDSTSSFVTAVDYLVSESGVPRATIQRLTSGRMALARESTADALVAAIGCPQAFHDGTLQVGVRRAGQFVPLDD